MGLLTITGARSNGNMTKPVSSVRAEDQPSWAEVVRLVELGESVSVIAHMTTWPT
jgi:hypothetical protein